MTSNLLLRNLEEAAKDLLEIPLWGSPPPFPLESFVKALADAFELEDFSLSMNKTSWADHPLEGMGETPFLRPFVLSPLPSEFFFAMPSSNLSPIAKSLLSKEGKSKGLVGDDLLHGLIEVALLRACQTCNNLSPFGNLSVAFAEETPLPELGALCMDLTLLFGKKKLPARIIAPKEGISTFRSYFEMEKPPFSIDKAHAHLPISLSLEIGSTQLMASEWKEVKRGDWIQLDRCMINLEEDKGTAILSAKGVALFDIRIKGSEAKILDYAMTQKETPMTEDQPENAELEVKPLPADQIPLTITVEIGHLQMPLEKLSQLQPGNVLDLEVSRAQDVHLTISGKCIATGELIALGDAVGVKILKIGE